MNSFLKKMYSNILFGSLSLLRCIPATGLPIRAFITGLFAGSPSEISLDKQRTLDTYNWRLNDLSGTVHDLSESKGKVVLINFWATWCPPCIAEMPSLQKLYEAYGDRVDFYFVSSEAPQKLRDFMKKKGYTFPVYVQGYQEPTAIETTSLPTTYVISKSGKLVMQETGAENWNADSVHTVLDKLLRE
jgi:thiol-disulfide isomerase/thioredoxin